MFQEISDVRACRQFTLLAVVAAKGVIAGLITAGRSCLKEIGWHAEGSKNKAFIQCADRTHQNADSVDPPLGSCLLGDIIEKFGEGKVLRVDVDAIACNSFGSIG